MQLPINEKHLVIRNFLLHPSHIFMFVYVFTHIKKVIEKIKFVKKFFIFSLFNESFNMIKNLLKIINVFTIVQIGKTIDRIIVSMKIRPYI